MLCRLGTTSTHRTFTSFADACIISHVPSSSEVLLTGPEDCACRWSQQLDPLAHESRDQSIWARLQLASKSSLKCSPKVSFRFLLVPHESSWAKSTFETAASSEQLGTGTLSVYSSPSLTLTSPAFCKSYLKNKIVPKSPARNSRWALEFLVRSSLPE